jgi:hypothetical protein
MQSSVKGTHTGFAEAVGAVAAEVGRLVIPGCVLLVQLASSTSIIYVCCS